MWGKTHCFDVQCKLSRNSIHLSRWAVLSIAWVHNYNPTLYAPPPFLKYATQLPKSNSNCQRVHEGRLPGPCINCKREDVTKRYWHLSQRRDQPLFYTFVTNAYAFKDDVYFCRMCEARFRKSLEMSYDTEATSSKRKLRKYDTAIDISLAFETNNLNLTTATLTAIVMCHLTHVNLSSILQLMQKIMTVVKNMYAFCNTWTCVKKVVTIRHPLILTLSSRAFRLS